MKVLVYFLFAFLLLAGAAQAGSRPVTVAVTSTPHPASAPAKPHSTTPSGTSGTHNATPDHSTNSHTPQYAPSVYHPGSSHPSASAKPDSTNYKKSQPSASQAGSTNSLKPSSTNSYKPTLYKPSSTNSKKLQSSAGTDSTNSIQPVKYKKSLSSGASSPAPSMQPDSTNSHMPGATRTHDDAAAHGSPDPDDGAKKTRPGAVRGLENGRITNPKFYGSITSYHDRFTSVRINRDYVLHPLAYNGYWGDGWYHGYWHEYWAAQPWVWYNGSYGFWIDTGDTSVFLIETSPGVCSYWNGSGWVPWWNPPATPYTCPY